MSPPDPRLANSGDSPWLSTLALTLPAIGVRIADLVRQLVPVLMATLAMAAAVYAVKTQLSGMLPPLKLLVLVPIGAFTYGAILWLVWPHVLRETWGMLRKGKTPAAPEAAH